MTFQSRRTACVPLSRIGPVGIAWNTNPQCCLRMLTFQVNVHLCRGAQVPSATCSLIHFPLPLFHSGNISWLFLFLLPSLMILLFVFLLHLLCLLECLFPPLLPFSAEFSHILLRSLWRLALSLSSFLLFIIFLSFLFPPLFFCYLLLLLEFVFLTLQNCLLRP
jgi:hypothetical protein